MDRLPQELLRIDVPQLALGVHGHVGGLLLVRLRRMRRLRPQVRRLRNMRLQLVVSLGHGLLRAMRSYRPKAREWVDMPTVTSESAVARPKYSLDGNALVVYRLDRAYVAFEDDAARGELARHSDVHVLNDSENRAFEEGLPFPLPPPRRSRVRVTGLGDAIALVTGALGIRECTGCAARRRRLNKIGSRRRWARGQ